MESNTLVIIVCVAVDLDESFLWISTFPTPHCEGPLNVNSNPPISADLVPHMIYYPGSRALRRLSETSTSRTLHSSLYVQAINPICQWQRTARLGGTPIGILVASPVGLSSLCCPSINSSQNTLIMDPAPCT